MLINDHSTLRNDYLTVRNGYPTLRSNYLAVRNGHPTLRNEYRQLEMAIRRSDIDIRHQISISTPEIRGFADKMIHL